VRPDSALQPSQLVYGHKRRLKGPARDQHRTTANLRVPNWGVLPLSQSMVMTTSRSRPESMTSVTLDRPADSTTAANAAAGKGPSVTPPSMFSEGSERLLLSIGLTETRKPLLNELLGLVSHDDFHIEHHGALWNIIRNLNDGQASHDAMAILDYTRSRNIFVGGVEYLAHLHDDPLAANASDDAVLAAAKRVKEYCTRRRLSALSIQAKALSESGQPVDQVISLIEDDLLNLRKLSESSRSGPQHIRVALGRVLEDMQNQMDGTLPIATSTGYDELDKLIYGLADEDFIILAARPSMGKTAAMMNLSRNVATGPARLPVLIYSTEMKDVALGRRALSRESHVNLESIRRADLNEMDFGRITEGLAKLEESEIWLDDTPGLSLHEIRSRSRSFVAKHGKCLIFVDYLQNIAPGPGQHETKEHVSAVSKGLKLLARELKVPVVALSQLSRTLEARANKRPIMSDLRESGQIEQDADVIIFLYRDSVYNPDTKEPGICEWIVSKQRDGAIGTVRLAFDGPTNHFYSVDGSY
jgi:replicative DNA helicase